MADDFITSSYPVISILIGVGTLGGFIYKMGSWINQKAEQKAIALRETTEKKANELKDYAIKAAKEVEIKTDGQIQDLRNKLVEIQHSTEKLAVLEDKIDKLSSHSDLVNGNVASIRTDIADLQEDLLELYATDQGNSSEEMEEDRQRPKKTRKQIELTRRIKKRQVELDRVNQSERTLQNRRGGGH